MVFFRLPITIQFLGGAGKGLNPLFSSISPQKEGLGSESTWEAVTVDQVTATCGETCRGHGVSRARAGHLTSDPAGTWT